MSHFVVDWLIRDNVHEREMITFEDGQTGTAINFTGSTFRLEVAGAAGQASVLVLTSPASGIEITNAAAGQLTLEIAPGQLSPGTYVYDLIRIAGAKRETLMAGAITVEKGVSA